MNLVTLIIDMQEDFFQHERLKQRRAELSRCINELVKICRDGDVVLVWVKQEFSPDLSDAMLENRKRGIRIVINGTPGASLLQELDCRPSDEFIIKKRYSPFFGTNLDELLARLRATHLIIAGINTHACVRTAVVDAYQRDYEVILAQDCIESHDAEHHDVSWRYMDGKLGRGMSNEEIRSLLAGYA
ncbi:MAG: cysteine hydrolase [Acidobacteriota bacterium]